MTYQLEYRVREVLQNGYDFPVIKYLKQGWQFFSNNPWTFIGFLLIVLVISMTLGFIPLIGSIASAIIGPALYIGYGIVCNRMEREEPYEFGNFFDGFKSLGQIALYVLVYSVFLMVLLIPTLVVMWNSGLFEFYQELLTNPTMMESPDDIDLDLFSGPFFLVLGLNLIPVIYLGLSYIWTPHFIVFGGMGFWEAMESSRRVVTRNWFGVFSLFLVIMGAFILIGALGGALMALSPVIGGLFLAVFLFTVLLLIPVLYCAIYAGFSDVMNLTAEDAGEQELTDHLIG